MNTITKPPADPAELATWLSKLPPETVLLDAARHVWQVRLAAVGLDRQEAGVIQHVDGPIRWEQDYPGDMADVATQGPFQVIHSPAPPPVIWGYDGTAYDLGRPLRGPRSFGMHWNWAGEFGPTGEPMLTPVGTADAALIGSQSPFSSVVRTDGPLVQSPPVTKAAP